eukprot:6178877-Pleurochrysis_carterae.AAC.5
MIWQELTREARGREAEGKKRQGGGVPAAALRSVSGRIAAFMNTPNRWAERIVSEMSSNKGECPGQRAEIARSPPRRSLMNL